jgi:hypothetical protein
MSAVPNAGNVVMKLNGRKLGKCVLNWSYRCRVEIVTCERAGTLSQSAPSLTGRSHSSIRSPAVRRCCSRSKCSIAAHQSSYIHWAPPIRYVASSQSCRLPSSLRNRQPTVAQS